MFSFLRSIFPDARFVWVDRDPRAVCYSYFLRQKVDLPAAMSEEEKQDKRLHHAAQRYLRVYDSLQAEPRAGYQLLLYEDFVANPAAQMRQLLEYSELPTDERLLRITARWPIRRDSNDAWKRTLSDGQRHRLESLLERPLKDRRYSSPEN